MYNAAAYISLKRSIQKALNTELVLAKILLLPPKYEIIMVPSNHSISNIAIAVTFR